MTDPMPVARTPAQIAADGVRVARQLQRIAHSNKAYQLARLAEVRARRRNARDYDVTDIDHAGHLLTARTGDILVQARDGARAAQLLGREFQQTAVLGNRVLRFSMPGLPATQAEARAAQLRTAGVDATPNYVVPLGYVTKQQGGFESSALDPTPDAPPRPPENAVRVAVVDTGVYVRRQDGWLDYVQRNNANFDPLYIPEDLPAHILDYAAGHGQFIAGIIQQVCPAADIRVYRAVRSDGIGDEVEVGEAILQAAADDARVINLSLGTQTAGDTPPVGLRTALESLDLDKVLVVAAAGNYGDDRPTWPAAFPKVVSVAALTELMAGAGWSSQGQWVQCSTVGEGIVSTFVPGTEAPEVDPQQETFGPNAWAIGCGTSFATPQIAGRVALALTDHPELTPREALDQHVLSAAAGARPLQNFGLAVRVLTGTSPT
jgi:subtilisin family serine protease